MEDYLRYGDLICLNTKNDYHMTTHGFISTSLHMDSSLDRDFFSSIFRIFPQTINSTQIELTSQSGSSESYSESVIRLKESAEGEIKTNMQIYQNFQGQQIKFGSLIQLQHVASGKFISIEPKENAEHERDNIKILVKDFASDCSQLRINFAYKYQKEGNAWLHNNDSVYLEFSIPGTNKIGYLHESENHDEVLKEVNCCFDSKTMWRFKLYSNVQDPELLVTGDYIWLYHTEIGSCVIQQGNYLLFSHSTHDSNGIWKIEGENTALGEVLKTNEGYRIKQLCSGMYLSLKTDFHKGKTKARPVLSAKKDVFSLWKFDHAYKKKKFVSKSHLYALVNCETEAVLDCRIGKEAPVVKNTESETAFFKIMKCEENNIKQTNLLLNCLIPAKKFSKYIKKLDMKSINVRNFLRIIGQLGLCIEQIQKYLNNSLVGFIDFQKQFGQIQAERQQLLREQKFIEMFTAILSNFHPDSIQAQSNNHEVFKVINRQLLETVGKIYQTLALIVFKNHANQVIAFSHIEVYMHHVNSVKQASEFLLALVENNQGLLFSLSKPSSPLIQHYTWLMRMNGQNRKPHLVQFLQSICSYQNTGVKLTQERIHEHLFLNPETFRKAVITTVAHLDTLSIILPGDKREKEILLNECFNSGEILDEYQVQISYFIRMLDLFACMCQDRNYTCKSSIKDWFPVDILLNYIRDENLSADIKATFVRLMVNMYVDSHPRHEEKFPESVKVLSLQENDDLVLKYKNLFSLETSEVSYVGQLKSTSTFTQYKKVSDFQNQGQVVFEGDELTLFRLKEDLIKHLQQAAIVPSYDVLLYELIVLASRLVKFNIISYAKSLPGGSSSVISPYNPLFSYEETDLAKLMRALMELIIFDDTEILKLTSLKSDKLNRRGKKAMPEISETIFEKAEQSPMKEVMKSYSNLVKMQAQVRNSDFTFKTQCRIEICKLFDYLLSWRLDFLVNNVIAWFNGVNKNPNQENFSMLFPPVGNKTSHFMLFKEPEIKDLSFFNPKIHQELVVQFVQSKDYEYRTLIILVLSKTFNMRSKLLKEINTIQIVTTIETSEMFVWVRNNIKVIKQIAEQSELWLNYWNQSGETRSKNLQKVNILHMAINEIDKALDNNSRLVGLNLVPGTTGVIDKPRQRTFVNLHIHEIIINLLQDSMQTISELFNPGANQSQIEAREKFSLILQSCYKLLSDLTRGNKKIQEIFHRYLNVFMAYLHIPVGQIDLICNIFKGNRKLCLKIDEKFLMQFTELIFKYGRQKKFLEIFEVVQGSSPEIIHENQRLVAKVLLDQDYQYLCFMGLGKVNQFVFEGNLNHVNQDYIDEPYEYHCKLLSIIAISASGGTGVYLTEMKCQKLLNFEYVLELLMKSNLPNYSIIYTGLLEFFYHAYIDTEKINENLMNSLSLINFIEFISKQLRLKGILSDKEINDLGLVIEILSRYISFYFIGAFFYDTYDIIKDFLESVKDKYDQIKESPFKQHIIEKVEILGKKYDIEFPSIFFDDYVENSSANRSVNQIKSSWHEFKLNILYNNSLKKLLKEEKTEIVNIIINISKYNASISTADVIVSFLEYINNYTFHKPKVSLLNKALKLLSLFIVKIRKSSEEMLKTVKQQLNDAGIVRTIMSLLCDSSTGSNTFVYLLKLSCEILDEGDFDFQSSFYNYFTLSQSAQNFFQQINSFFMNYLAYSKSKWEKNVLVYKEQLSGCEVLLRFLQLLCENHNELLQNYIRNQYKSRQSFNIVLSIVTLLEELLKRCRDFDFLVISQCFDTLTEFIQGPCKSNQVAIVDSKFLEVSSRLLSFDETSDNLSKYQLLKEEMLSSVGSRDAFSTECLTGWMIAHLKYKCMITLLSLLEGQTDNYVITRMIRSLNIEILKENVISFYHSYTLMYPPDYYDDPIFNHFEGNKNYHPKKDVIHLENPEYFQLIIEIGFMVYHLMCHFKDNEDPENKRIIMNELPELAVNDIQQGFMGTKLLADLGKFGLALFKSGLAQVKKIVKTNRKAIDEIDKSKILKSAYAFFQKHTGNIEVVFRDEIFRIYFWIRPEGHFITDEQKENFHFYVERSSHKAKVQYLLSEADKVIEEMIHEAKLSKLLKRNFLVSLIASYVSVWKEVAFLVTIALNCIIIASFFDNKASGQALVYEPPNNPATLKIINILGSIQMACSCCIVAFFLLKTAPVLIARGWRSHDWKNHSHFWLIKIFQKCKNGGLTLYFALSDVNVLYQIGYLCFSVLGTAAHPFFFSFHLLDILYRYPTLQNVIKSVTIPRKSLILSFLFIIILLYLYSIWAYLSFSSYFENDCTNLIRCLKVTFDQGLKNGGGIGEYLNNDDPEYYNNLRLAFDTLFYLMIIIIMLSVIQGIIADTFAYLREINEMNFQDRENRCFICSLDKEFIEYATERPFQYHSNFEHCEWNYITFINYLKNKDPSERTGLESYLNDMIEKSDSSWIPQYRALSIRQIFEEENALKKMIDNVEEIYTTLEKEMKETKKCMMEYMESKYIIR